jgi:nucleoid-associated protein YgaU
VIALVFLLVTIVAVALWGQRDEQGLLGFMKKSVQRPDSASNAPPARPAQPIVAEKQQLPLTPPTARDLPPVWTRTETGQGERQTEAALREREMREEWRRQQDLASRSSDPVGGAGVPNSVPASGVPPGAQLPLKSTTPPRGRDRTVTVARGDTLGEIALRELGTSKRWPEIAALNPGVDPNALRIGTLLVLPGSGSAAPAQAASPTTPPPAVGRTRPDAGSAGYVVRAGDTLGAIAQREPGTSTRWKEIVELNPGLDPQRLAIGASLRLPADAARVPAQERPLTVASTPKAAPTARELPHTGRRGGRVK